MFKIIHKRVVVGFGLLVLQYLAGQFFWASGFYDQFFWLDDVMHALGGFLVAYFLWNIFQTWKKTKQPINYWLMVIGLIGAVLIVGLAWETYELFYDLIFHTISQPSVTDTLGDLWEDVFGAAVFCWLNFKRKFD